MVRKTDALSCSNRIEAPLCICERMAIENEIEAFIAAKKRCLGLYAVCSQIFMLSLDLVSARHTRRHDRIGCLPMPADAAGSAVALHPSWISRHRI